MRQASSPLLTLLLLYMRTFPFNIFLAIGLLSLPACHFLKTDEPITPPREKTTTQTASPWKPELDVRADVAIIYGTKTQKYLDFGDGEVSFEQRVQSWKNQNYNVHFMTGISWGEYEEYLSGNWDGKIHKDESQQSRDGSICWHHDSVPYLVPTASFTRYLKQQKIRRIIDTGIDALYLAEPEFLNAAGYSPAFRRECPFQQTEIPSFLPCSRRLLHLCQAIRETSRPGYPLLRLPAFAYQLYPMVYRQSGSELGFPPLRGWLCSAGMGRDGTPSQLFQRYLARAYL